MRNSRSADDWQKHFRAKSRSRQYDRRFIFWFAAAAAVILFACLGFPIKSHGATVAPTAGGVVTAAAEKRLPPSTIQPQQEFQYRGDVTTHEPDRWPRWDYDNHSTQELHAPTAPPPGARVIDVQPTLGAEDAAWMQRCEVRIKFDSDGVRRYFWNRKPGCAAGQWED